MKQAAIGIKMHSGWGVLVAVSLEAGSVRMQARCRITTADPGISGSTQPYHHAARVEQAAGEAFLAHCTAASTHLAEAVLRDVARELSESSFQLKGCALLLASGRPLPPLARIFGSHPLIHTAEGEFFRQTVRMACESLYIPVTGMRERDLDERAKAAWGRSASHRQQAVASLAKAMGPPWTRDHKAAALAAVLILADQDQLLPTE